VATLAPDDSRVKDQIKRIQDYVWAVYIDGTQPREQIDEQEALQTLDAFYSEVGNRNSPDQVYLGILLFEKAFEEPESLSERFERARKIFEFYRRVTGEDDWNAVEDRLEDIEAHFQEESGEPAPAVEAEPVAEEPAPVAEPAVETPVPATEPEPAPEPEPEPEPEPVVAETPQPAVEVAEPEPEPVVEEPAPVAVEDEVERAEAEEEARRREAAEAFTAGLEVVEGMCLVPAGIFLYGADKREIFLDSFYIDLMPVTNAEYMRFVRETGYRPPRYLNKSKLNDARQPVVGISFGDAQQFAKWAGKELPTELQWEKAARGTDGRPYAWGNEPPSSSRACFGLDPIAGAPAPVGESSYDSSPFGVRDMCGNVWEWTTTTIGKNSAFKVLRGGCYNDPIEFLRTDFRLEAHPKDKCEAIGFRCVKNIHG
jgi:serine/threonine-protein kinase